MKRLENHRGDPAADEQRNVVVDELGDDRVSHVVVLTIHVQTGCRTQRRVGGGGTGIAQRARRTDDCDRGGYGRSKRY